MTRIYLDSNIFIYIENSQLSIEDVRIESDIASNQFLYSSAHVQEAKERKSKDPEQTENWIEQRIETIRQLTNNNYLYHELPSNNVCTIEEDPRDVLNTINEVDPANTSMRNLMNFLSEPLKGQLRDQMGIVKGELNDKEPKEVISKLNTKLKGYGTNQSFIEMIEYAISLNPQGSTFGLHNRIAGIFELLDMLGFWTDKHNEKSNYARLWDSTHAYFSSTCDYFISDDKRTRNKTKVAFDIYKIPTKVLSSKELKEMKKGR